MSASELDKLQKVGIGTATTLSAPGKAAAATSITVGSTANFPTTTGITFAIRVVDGNGELVAGTYTEWVGTVTSGTTLAMNAVPVYGSDQVYAAGSTTQVYMPLSSYSYNKHIDALLEEHEQLDGTHKATLITSRTEDTSPDPDADFLLTYDTSATALKKVKPSSLGIGDSWVRNSLPAVSSVTENGNRSADITFASTVASLLTPGMRIRTSRTVAAPTQCTDLEASSTQYYSKASPNKLTFTDDFVVSAWVKLESYQGASGATMVSRFDGTNNGWRFDVTTDGLVRLIGHNAGASNISYVASYQSLPLGKWVHVAAQLDMSAFTATTTTSYIMFDGIDIPAQVLRGGTNPTALVQAGDLRIGYAGTAGTYFDGKIAQVAIFNAKVTQATMRTYKNQGLSGSETSLASAYSCNNSLLDLNTTTPNDLTASGGALMTNADSPFTVDANGVPHGTYDWAIVTKVATTVATVQYPEGCAIPTSGGISTVDYSGVKAPFGMPTQRNRWEVIQLILAQQAMPGTTAGTWYNLGASLTIPVGSWVAGYSMMVGTSETGSAIGLQYTLSTANNSETNFEFTAGHYMAATGASSVNPMQTANRARPLEVTTQGTYYFNMSNDVTSDSITIYAGYGTGTVSCYINAELAYL